MLLRAGERVDRYTLVKPLGEGGQGSVWKVIDPLDGGRVRALKIVELDYPDAPASERARREANALARARHPALIACHAVYEDPESRFVALVLDLVNGEALAEVLGDPRMSTGHRLAILKQVASALEHIHAEGLVHRDLKPENLLITEDFWSDPGRAGGVKIIDFGIAAKRGNPRPLTATGGFIGTTPYLAPEIVDPATWGPSHEGFGRDLFAFGVIAWALLFPGAHPTGLQPTATPIDYARFYKAAEAGRVAWPPGGLRGPWAVVVSACLALRPTERPASGAGLMQIIRTGINPMAATTRASSPALASRTTPHAAPPVAAGVSAAYPVTTEGPRPRPAPSWRWAVLGFLLAMGGTGAAVIWSGWFESFKPDPAPVVPSVAPTTPPPLVTRTAAPAPAPPPRVELAVCCGGVDCPRSQRDVKGSSCESHEELCEKCTSGRMRVDGACREALVREHPYQLRLAHVVVGGKGLVARDATVQVRLAGPPASTPVNMAVAGSADFPHPDPSLIARLPITTAALLAGGGLDIWIWEGGKQIASKSRVVVNSPSLLTTALCRGFSLSVEPATVFFYLED